MDGTITAITVQERNPERVNVYLNGQYAFSLDAVMAARLRPGQSLSADDVSQLQTQDNISKAYERAVRYLGTRPRSVAEVRRKLCDKGIAPSIIEIVIHRLEEMGYVDDEAFARFWVQNRGEYSPRGQAALRYELRQKGIDDEIIDTVLDDFDATDAALRAARQKARTLRNIRDKHIFKQKLGSYLARRGFSYDVVQPVVNLLIEEREVENDTFEE
ncbi:MAG: RecX family transcriptional regulator [Phototrophicales bacterium]|nr:MAG: RecX family transcriptional regulator [Phototrophicales bacterium]